MRLLKSVIAFILGCLAALLVGPAVGELVTALAQSPADALHQAIGAFWMTPEILTILRALSYCTVLAGALGLTGLRIAKVSALWPYLLLGGALGTAQAAAGAGFFAVPLGPRSIFSDVFDDRLPQAWWPISIAIGLSWALVFWLIRRPDRDA